MAEYAPNINSADYRDAKPIYVTEISGQIKTSVPLELSLDSSNFNFDTARSDGLDFRLAESQNGSGVLKMWVAYWSYSNQKATLWFKLPQLPAGDTKTLWVFWGRENDTGISDLTTLSGAFLFADDFSEASLDSTKWSNVGSYTISNSQIDLAQDAYITTVGNPLENVESWIVEEGLYGIGSPTSTTTYAHRYIFYGGENEFEIRYYWDGSVDRRHNFEDGGSVATYDDTNRGLEKGSYSQNYIAYRESTDNVHQSMSKRATYSDYDDSWERQVHRNTELTYFRIYGEDTASADGAGIDWVVVREYTPDTDPTIDLSALYIPYQTIGHQPLDTTAYASDVTSVDYYHSSDIGGDPYRLADNITNNISNVFISDTTTSGSVLIDFGRGDTNLVSNTYLHFDNDHVTYYNASKLSDLDADIYSRDYWQCTTTSGAWAAIQFPSAVMVGCLAVTAVSSDLDGMIKDFEFYGTNYDPRFATAGQKDLLTSGTFSRVSTEQTVYFTTKARVYTYYILETLSTYGNNVALQEWGMYELTDDVGKRVISQLRFHPVDIVSQEYYFPKEIRFHGSNDMVNWTEFLELTETYTPFFDATYGRWQRFSITNNDAYYVYKVTCTNNWHAQDDTIKIAEWEMVEKVSESNNFRILEGSSANVNNVWADDTATFESGNVYITNDKLNVVLDDMLIESTTPADTVDDMNVKL